MRHLKRHMIGVLAELAAWCGRDKEPRLCRRSRFSLFYKLPSLSRLLVHLPLSCSHTSPLAFLPLTSYLFFLPPPSPIGSEWTTRPAMSPFVFSRPLSLRPSLLLPALSARVWEQLCLSESRTQIKRHKLLSDLQSNGPSNAETVYSNDSDGSVRADERYCCVNSYTERAPRTPAVSATDA